MPDDPDEDLLIQLPDGVKRIMVKVSTEEDREKQEKQTQHPEQTGSTARDSGRETKK